MNRDVLILREVVQKLVPMLTGKGLKVTQRGSQAYVDADAKTGKPVLVNIPSISDNATPEFLRAIQGFIDHEVAHVLITDYKFIGEQIPHAKLGDPDVRAFLHTHNIIEDTMIEKEIRKIFPGSKANLADVRRYFIDRVTGPALKSAKDEKEEFIYLLVPMMRALAGHEEFAEFMDKGKFWKNPFVEALLESLDPATLSALKSASSTQDTWEIAKTVHSILYPPPPPAPSAGKSEDKPDQKAGEGDGDGERDHSDSDPGEDGEADEAQPAEGDADDEKEKDAEQSDPKSGDGEDDDAKNDDDVDEGEGASGDGDEDDSEKDDGSSSDEGDEKDEGEASDDAADDGDAGTSEDGDDKGDAGTGDADTDDDDEGEGAVGTAAGSETEGDADGSEKSGEAPVGIDGKSTGESREAQPEDVLAEEGEKNASQPGGGIGTAPGHSMFDFDEDAFEEVDLSSSISALISKDAVEAMRDRSEYHVYTRELDKIEPLNVPDGMNSKWVPELEDSVRQMTGSMAKDIERMMASRSFVIRTPGHRKGKLHTPSLFKLNFGEDRVFSQRQQYQSKDTAVTLLVDNSGSMGGRKMKTAMVSAFALSSTLERVGITHEVIGFTTGNYYSLPTSMQEAIYEEMRSHKIQYDRTTPIVMPIYKDFDERITATVKRRIAYAANAQNGLNGNIDGESLEYAAARLMKRREERKVIMVLSDGQPAAGPKGGPHLRLVIDQLKKVKIETIGIGIEDASVRAFYDNHVVLQSALDLPGQVMTELKKILM